MRHTTSRTNRTAAAAGGLATVLLAGPVWADPIELPELECSGFLDYIGHQTQDFIVPNLPGDMINFRVAGADGGNAVVAHCDAEGGDGATIGATWVIGDGPDEIPPGAIVRFIVGQRGQHGYSGGWSFGGTAGGGGGGTGVLIDRDGTGNWEGLVVAGGGGGGRQSVVFSFCAPSDSEDCKYGLDGNTGECGTTHDVFEEGAGCDGEAGETEGALGGGGGLYTSASSSHGGKAGLPAGGAGGDGDAGGEGADGGWGCGGGGGGYGEDEKHQTSGGAGGGYSGGGVDFLAGGGGGGSWIAPGGFWPSYEDGSPDGDAGYAWYWITPSNTFAIGARDITPGQTRPACLYPITDADPIGCTFDPTMQNAWYEFTNDMTYPREFRLELVSAAPVAGAVHDLFGSFESPELCIDASGVGEFTIEAGDVRFFRILGTEAVDVTFTEITPDSDGDGIPDVIDPCPGVVSSGDLDGDGICNGDDPWPECFGGAELGDFDGDGIADPCDPTPTGEDDCNDNGISDGVEPFDIHTIRRERFVDVPVRYAVNGIAQAPALDEGVPAGLLTPGGGVAGVGTLVFETPIRLAATEDWEITFDFRMVDGQAITFSWFSDDLFGQDTEIPSGGIIIGSGYDSPMMEVTFSGSLWSGPGGPNAVRVHDEFGHQATVPSSFTLDDGRWYTAVISYADVGYQDALLVSITDDTGTTETLFDGVTSPPTAMSAFKPGWFAFGATSSGLSRHSLGQIVFTDRMNGDDCDFDGIPDSCDPETCERPAHDWCDGALLVTADATEVDPTAATNEDLWYRFIPDPADACANPIHSFVFEGGGPDDGDIDLFVDCSGTPIDNDLLYDEIPAEGVLLRVRTANPGTLLVQRTASQPDTDGDGVVDACDPCPLDANDDSDGDGVCDSFDLCPGFDDALDGDGDGIPDACDDGGCYADFDDSGAVDFADIITLLSFWGTESEVADLDADGSVGFGDLVALLSAWGPCAGG